MGNCASACNIFSRVLPANSMASAVGPEGETTLAEVKLEGARLVLGVAGEAMPPDQCGVGLPAPGDSIMADEVNINDVFEKDQVKTTEFSCLKLLKATSVSRLFSFFSGCARSNSNNCDKINFGDGAKQELH